MLELQLLVLALEAAQLLAPHFHLAVTDGLSVREQEDQDGPLTLLADLISGSAPGDEDDGAFDTLSGTNHKYHGFVDLILNPLVQLQGRGLKDYTVKSRSSVAGRGTLTVNVHRLLVWEDAGLDDGVLGDDIDVVSSHPVGPSPVSSSGDSHVLAGRAPGAVRGIDDDVTFFYVMLDFSF